MKKKTKKKPIKKPVDLSDGVDYVRHSMVSRKGAPLADYEPCDGSIMINLDEIWNQIKMESFMMSEQMCIDLYMETYIHEISHKWFCWGMSDDNFEDGTFNEMDERVMRVISDWIQFDKMTKMEMYDWK